MKEKRQRELRHRKNFLSTLILTLFFWIAIIFFIYFVDPNSFGAIPIFFLTLFLVLFFSTTLLTSHTRAGFIISLATTFFAILRYFGVGNLLNLFLLAGVAIAFEIYFSKKY